MKTGDLISMLSTGVEPIDPKRIARRHLISVGGGSLAAVALMATALKLNPALPQELSEPMFWVREAFCASLAVVGILGTARLARPGRPPRWAFHQARAGVTTSSPRRSEMANWSGFSPRGKRSS